jgi:RNA polymerase sigma-70 factor (ECF subfamily)
VTRGGRTSIAATRAAGRAAAAPVAAAAPAAAEARAASEAPVLAALDAGDVRGALTLLVRELGTPVYRYCRQMVGDDALADDVHQAVFVKVFEHLGRFERRASLRSWVFSIAHNRCLDVLKSGRRRADRFAPSDELHDPEDAGPSAIDRLSAEARRAAVARCLERLAPHARTAVLLRYQEELSYEEMAEACGERAGTLQARVARTLPVLRRCIEEQGGAG